MAGKKTTRIALEGSSREKIQGATTGKAVDPEQRIYMSIRVRAKGGDDAKLETALMKMGAIPPKSRAKLSQQQFADAFGADPKDVAKVEDFAHTHGLTVTAVHLPSRTIKVEGSAEAVQKAFGVTLNVATKAGATFRQRTGSIHIPKDLKSIITGIHGIDNRPVARAHFRVSSRQLPLSKPHATNGSLAVGDIASLYNFPKGLTGAGQCIAIIELNDLDNHGKPNGAGFKTSDLAGFFKKGKVPSVVSVGVDGGANLPGKSDADGEVVLDIEVAGAVAPDAQIAVYFAPNTTNGFIDAIKAAAHDTLRKPSVISISWGGPEDPDGQINQQFVDGLNEAIRDAAAMGVTVCVAAGDDGSADMGSNWDHKPHADFPSSSPFALSCGGTKLVASGATIVSEEVWNGGRNDGAGGGGVSGYFKRPAYQKAVKVPKSASGFNGRGVPDVAGDADPATGYQIFLNGQSDVIGGTSAVAPLMAGLVALINENLAKKGKGHCGFFNPLIYKKTSAKVFRDIVSGDNDIEGNLGGTYSAGTGWDACSGLGVPDGTKLLKLLS